MPSRKIAAEPNLSAMPFEYQWHCVAHTVPTPSGRQAPRLGRSRVATFSFVLGALALSALGLLGRRAPRKLRVEWRVLPNVCSTRGLMPRASDPRSV